MVSFPWIYPVRAAQLVFAIIVLGLTAYVVSWVHGGSATNFMLFNGVWSIIIALPYLTLAPVYLPSIGHRFIVLAIEVLTMIFWFAGFIALGASLPPAHWCHGSHCRSLQAATAFGSFEWALFAATTVMSVLAVVRPGHSPSTKPARTPAHVGA